MCCGGQSAIKALSQGAMKRYEDAWSVLRRSKDGQISGTKVLQNLKLVVLKTTNPQISGTKVLETCGALHEPKHLCFSPNSFFVCYSRKPAERFTNQIAFLLVPIFVLRFFFTWTNLRSASRTKWRPRLRGRARPKEAKEEREEQEEQMRHASNAVVKQSARQNCSSKARSSWSKAAVKQSARQKCSISNAGSSSQAKRSTVKQAAAVPPVLLYFTIHAV